MSEAGAERERERERIPTRFHAQYEAQPRAWFHNTGIMTWANIESQTLNQLNHPSVPRAHVLKWNVAEGHLGGPVG